jgi:hypothetical protein
LGGSTQPISGWAEDQRVDDISGFEGIQVLSFVEIPQHGGSVSSSRSAQRTIRRDGNSVDVTRVTNEVGSQLAGGQVPYLDDFIPSTRNDNWVLRRESDAADPFAVSLFFKSVFALSEGVPQLDGLITRSRDDLSVVCREGNTQNILGVSNESSGSGSSIQIPQSEGSIPRSRQTELSIGRDDNVLNEVGVSMEGSSGSSVVLIGFSGEVPDEETLVS